MNEDIVKKMGCGALATRLKRISDALYHSSRKMYRDLGLSMEPNWYLVLKIVSQMPNSSIADLSKNLKFRHQSMAAITTKMEKVGYLTSHQGSMDKRKTTFCLTEKAIRELPLIAQIWDKGEESMIEILENDLTILSLLTSIEANLDTEGFGDRILNKLNSVNEKSQIRNPNRVDW